MTCANSARLIFSFIVLFILVSCAPVRPIPTPSGIPEVTVSNVPKAKIVNHITNYALTKGFQIRTLSDYQAIYFKRSESIGAALLFGSRYDSIPEERITFTFLETGKNIRVIANGSIVTNPGSGFERITDLTRGKAGYNIYNFLQGMKHNLETAQTGRIGVFMDLNSGKIIRLIDKGPAMKAGLAVGDIVVRIDGEPLVLPTTYEKLRSFTGTPGTYVELTIQRGGKEIPLKIERQIIEE